MSVNVVQRHVEIGVFDALCDARYTTKFSCSIHSPSKKPEKKPAAVVIFTSLLFFMSGDIELNPGPIKTNSFFFLVWARRPPHRRADFLYVTGT